MLIRVLLFIALGGFVFGSVGGWEASKRNTTIALEKWDNYRAGTRVVIWPMQVQDSDWMPLDGRPYVPNLHQISGPYERALQTCPGVVQVTSDLDTASLRITVKIDELDGEQFTKSLPPLRGIRPEQVEGLLK